MRSKRKMETVRIRKANATIKKEKVVCSAQDRDVSTRILAILSVCILLNVISLKRYLKKNFNSSSIPKSIRKTKK